MGDIKRKRKKFTRPRKLYEAERISRENALVKKYGLKNKKEIWKSKTSISTFRRRAKKLISANADEQIKFFEKLNKMGFKITTISDALALNEEDLLERRLQTFLFKKKFANSPKQARQFITHKRVLVDGKVVNIPSFIITKELENAISLRPLKEKIKNTGGKNGEERE